MYSKEKKKWIKKNFKVAISIVIFGSVIGFISGIIKTETISLQYILKGAIVSSLVPIIVIISATVLKVREID
jgi:hypothetical protein